LSFALAESQEKKTQLEHLNRELRQVNLQQFIRQTGSKVTVLPPVAEKGTLLHSITKAVGFFFQL